MLRLQVRDDFRKLAMGRSRAIPFPFLIAVVCVAILQGCSREAGETRVAIKTSLPSGADAAHPRALSFADVASIPDPPGVQSKDSRYDKARIPAFPNPFGVKEGDVVSLRAWLQVATYMGDGDYNLKVTFSAASRDHYIVCEIPDEDDVADPALQKMVDSARNFVKTNVLGGHDPSRQGTVLSDPPYVEVSGQLFFSDYSVGSAPTADRQGFTRATNWQVHPLLTISAAPKPTP
ncbi:MAG TPA: hypothetical protein VLY23_08670 [Candidatus Acidoferrum sp.]|nr:hypothetical protein [Candidatus Acidoferrum sp.]